MDKEDQESEDVDTNKNQSSSEQNKLKQMMIAQNVTRNILVLQIQH